MQEGQENRMAQTQRKLSGETEALIREATGHPVVVEIDGKPHEVRVRSVSTPSPFTVDSAYASITTSDGRRGEDISAKEFNQMIEDAREDYTNYLMEKMKSE